MTAIVQRSTIAAVLGIPARTRRPDDAELWRTRDTAVMMARNTFPSNR